MTLKVTFSEPYGPFLRMLTQMEFGVLPSTAADMAVEDFGQKPVGSGPSALLSGCCKTISRCRQPELQLGAAGYLRPQRSAVSGQDHHKFLTGGADRIAALEAGELDAIFPVPEIDVAGLRPKVNTPSSRRRSAVVRLVSSSTPTSSPPTTTPSGWRSTRVSIGSR